MKEKMHLENEPTNTQISLLMTPKETEINQSKTLQICFIQKKML